MFAHRGICWSVAAGLGLGLLPGTPTSAEEGVFVRDALSNLGLIEPERPTITYRERAPLVMPPKLDRPLPTPQARESSPQWPKDPDVIQRERAAVEARKPITRGAQGRMNDNNETLSVYEMDAGRRAGAGIPGGPVERPGDSSRDGTWLSPLQMLTGGSNRTEPSAGEPDRSALTQPPTGYRRAPMKVATPQSDPVGGSISGNEEADPRAYMRSQSGR